MKTTAATRRVVDEITALTPTWTGYGRDAIQRTAIEHVVRSALDAGATIEQLHDRAAGRDPALVDAVAAAVSVRETFFFRQPEHFRWIARSIPRWKSAKLRVWSAGCATGEETYSLAACLSDCVGPGRFTVLGTDLVQRHVDSAREGVFGSWSIRTSSPWLSLALGPAASPKSGQFAVDPALRAHVRFERHNLLDEPPPCQGGFHIIVCRNVLLYFSREHADATAARLAGALAPNGVLLFGALDVSRPPDGCRWLEPRELNIFEQGPRSFGSTRPSKRASVRAAVASPEGRPSARASASKSAPRRPSARASPSTASPRRAGPWGPAIALHRRALVLIERGQRARAERLLAELRMTAPDYLPGILEEGLFHARAGDVDRALQSMRDLARRCEGLAGETAVHGPETLSIEYYRLAASVYFGQRIPNAEP